MNEKIMNIEEFSRITLDEFWKLLENCENQNDIDKIFDILHAECATNIELFSTIFFPHYCKFAFNQFHLDTFRDYKLHERAVRRVSAAPRGFAKSTIKALIKPIHDIVYNLEKFIVIFSSTEPQAVQKLKDIQSELINNDLLIAVYGNFIKGKKVGSTDFVATQGDFKCRILAVGSGTEVRGIRFGESRPTKIICDDVEHSDEVENEAIREKMQRWYDDVVSKIGNDQTNIEFVGTILHRQSLLKSLLNNPRYFLREYKAIISWSERKDLWDKWTAIYCNMDDEQRLDNALKYYHENENEMMKGVQVLWPEKEPYYKLMEEIIESGIRSFMKEKMGDPQSSMEKIFIPEHIHWYQETEKGFFVERSSAIVPMQNLVAFGAIDPATGQTKVSTNRNPDYTAIITGFRDMKNRLFVHDIFMERVAPTFFIQKIFDLNEFYQYRGFGVETNLFRNLLMDNIRTYKEKIERESKRTISIEFQEITLDENKQKRIYTLEPKIFSGQIVFNRKLKSLFFDQLYDFPKASHDDGPDCLEMLWNMVNNGYRVGGFSKAR